VTSHPLSSVSHTGWALQAKVALPSQSHSFRGAAALPKTPAKWKCPAPSASCASGFSAGLVFRVSPLPLGSSRPRRARQSFRAARATRRRAAGFAPRHCSLTSASVGSWLVPHQIGLLLRPTAAFKQDDAGLGPVKGLGIEGDRAARDSHSFKSPPRSPTFRYSSHHSVGCRMATREHGASAHAARSQLEGS